MVLSGPDAGNHTRLGWKPREEGGRGVSTTGGGGDTTIPSMGRSPKQPLSGIGLHDPLHGRQACPESNPFHQGFGQISPRKGLLSCRPLPKRGQICDIPAPPQSLNDSKSAISSSLDFKWRYKENVRAGPKGCLHVTAAMVFKISPTQC